MNRTTRDEVVGRRLGMERLVTMRPSEVIDRLRELARKDMTVKWGIDMYLSQLAGLEDCLVCMIETLSRLNTNLTERLIQAEQLRPPPGLIVTKELAEQMGFKV